MTLNISLDFSTTFSTSSNHPGSHAELWLDLFSGHSRVASTIVTHMLHSFLRHSLADSVVRITPSGHLGLLDGVRQAPEIQLPALCSYKSSTNRNNNGCCKPTSCGHDLSSEYLIRLWWHPTIDLTNNNGWPSRPRPAPRPLPTLFSLRSHLTNLMRCLTSSLHPLE